MKCEIDHQSSDVFGNLSRGRVNGFCIFSWNICPTTIKTSDANPNIKHGV